MRRRRRSCSRCCSCTWWRMGSGWSASSESEGSTVGVRRRASLWQVRAAAWELAALSFRYGRGELEGAVASGGWDEAAEEVASALGLALPGGRGAPAPPGGPAARGPTRLFVGAPEPACPPYEACGPPRPRVRRSCSSTRAPWRSGASCAPAGSAAPAGTSGPSTTWRPSASCCLPGLPGRQGHAPGGRAPGRRPSRRLPREPPTGASSPGTPAPGCPPSPSASPPRPATFYRAAAACL